MKTAIFVNGAVTVYHGGAVAFILIYRIAYTLQYGRIVKAVSCIHEVDILSGCGANAFVHRIVYPLVALYDVFKADPFFPEPVRIPGYNRLCVIGRSAVFYHVLVVSKVLHKDRLDRDRKKAGSI